MDGWIVVRDWDRFQHYHAGDRDMIWVKNYVRLLHNDEYLELTGHQRAVLHGLWLVYASSRCQVRANTASLTRQLALRVTSHTLEALNHAGFIAILARSEQNREETEKSRTEQTVPRPVENPALESNCNTRNRRELPPDLLDQIARLGGADKRTPSSLQAFAALPEAAFRNALEATREAQRTHRLHGTPISYFVGTLKQLTDTGQYQ